MVDNIAYKNYRKQDDIHGTIIYPAPMIAPVQKVILEDLIDKEKDQTIFDPFHGSGTALYESFQLSDKIKVVGCDINPLANLITRVKLDGIEESRIEFDIKQLEEEIKYRNIDEEYTFSRMDKWFRDDIIDDLRIVRSAIRQIHNSRNRRYFWYNMADIVRKYCNSRTSTYKLHIKDKMSIERLQNNVIRDFLSIVKKNRRYFTSHASDYELYKTDVLKLIKSKHSNLYDITITSPPYGDNKTTVPYGEYSMLPIYWIDPSDLELEGWELENYSTIDVKSLGGHKVQKYTFTEKEYHLLSPYLNQITMRKREKVKNFFAEYFSFLREICRVTDRYIVMTLGNRKVDGIKINLTEITVQMLELYGFKNRQILQREIQKKRTPKRTSRVNNKSVTSMTYEYIIIHEH